MAKPTRLRCWPRALPSLGKRCAWLSSQQEFSCGHSRTWPHETLGFGGLDTAVAAEYSDGVVEAWARDLGAWDTEIKAGPRTATVRNSGEASSRL
eukprot:697745-Heterocapsa_arctica.AAC.1